MANWTEILLNTLKLTDEVQKLNHLTEKLSDKTIDLDKRLVRIETLVEVAKYQTKAPKIGKDWTDILLLANNPLPPEPP